MLNEKKLYEKNINDLEYHLHFVFSGTEKYHDINYKKLNLLIDNIFENRKVINNIESIISYIRTIFKDFNEESLRIVFQNKSKKYSIILNQKNFENFFMEKYFENSDLILKLSYNDRCRFHDIKIHNYVPKYNVGDVINEELKLIESIRNIEAKSELCKEESILCQLYHLFYNKFPDFSEEKIDREVQLMMYILGRYNAVLNSYPVFSVRSDGLLYNALYDRLVERLVPLGQIQEFDRLISNEALINKIKLIGKEVRNYISDNQNQITSFEQICLVDYLGNKGLSKSVIIKHISEHGFIDYSETEIIKILTLTKKFKNI